MWRRAARRTLFRTLDLINVTPEKYTVIVCVAARTGPRDTRRPSFYKHIRLRCSTSHTGIIIKCKWRQYRIVLAVFATCKKRTRRVHRRSYRGVRPPVYVFWPHRAQTAGAHTGQARFLGSCGPYRLQIAQPVICHLLYPLHDNNNKIVNNSPVSHCRILHSFVFPTHDATIVIARALSFIILSWWYRTISFAFQRHLELLL